MKYKEIKDLYAEFERRCPPEDIETSQGTFTVYSIGKGERTLLFLPGGTGRGGVFFRYMLGLESYGRILTVDYPNIDNIPGYVRGITEVLRQLSVPKADLLGYSFGGILAQVLVREYPDKFPKVLLNHTASVDREAPEDIVEQKKASFEQGLRMIQSVPAFVVGWINKRRIKEILSGIGDSEQRKFWAEFMRSKAKEKGKEASLSLLMAMVDFAANYRFGPEDLTDYKGEIMIVESTADGAFSSIEKECVRRAHPFANVVTFRDHSHYALLTEYDRYFEIFREFFSEV